MSGTAFDLEQFWRLAAAEELLERVRTIEPRGADAEQPASDEALEDVSGATQRDVRAEKREEQTASEPAWEEASPEKEMENVRGKTVPEQEVRAELPARESLGEDEPLWTIDSGARALRHLELASYPESVEPQRQKQEQLRWTEREEGSLPTTLIYRSWDRKWERESRRYDSGFSLF